MNHLFPFSSRTLGTVASGLPYPSGGIKGVDARKPHFPITTSDYGARPYDFNTGPWHSQ